MKINQIYIYEISDIKYFTKEVINNITNEFNIQEIYPNIGKFVWIEFEALLRNTNKDILLIDKTFLPPYQFKDLSKGLFKALEQELYDNEKNEENLSLVFLYKFRHILTPSFLMRILAKAWMSFTYCHSTDWFM